MQISLDLEGRRHCCHGCPVPVAPLKFFPPVFIVPCSGSKDPGMACLYTHSALGFFFRSSATPNTPNACSVISASTAHLNQFTKSELPSILVLVSISKFQMKATALSENQIPYSRGARADGFFQDLESGLGASFWYGITSHTALFCWL